MARVASEDTEEMDGKAFSGEEIKEGLLKWICF